jgi:hypothetical protein
MIKSKAIAPVRSAPANPVNQLAVIPSRLPATAKPPINPATLAIGL